MATWYQITHKELARRQHQFRTNDGETMDESESITQLQRLMTNGFIGKRIPDEAGNVTGLVYMRVWSCGLLDVVLVYNEGEASAFRARGVDPLHLSDPRIRDLCWHMDGPVTAVASSMLDLPAPDSVPISARPASPVILNHASQR